MNGYQIEARRHAREVVGDMRWQGVTVPPLYVRMAGELEDLVRSDGYAAWVAAHQHHARAARPVRPAPAGHLARDLLSNPAPGR